MGLPPETWNQNVCKFGGKIIDIQRKEENYCLSIYTLKIKNSDGKVHQINVESTTKDCGGFFVDYKPKLGNNIFGQYNQDSKLINEIYNFKGETLEKMNANFESIDIPYCTGNIVKEEAIKETKQEPSKVQPINNTQNYYLFGIIIFLLFIIAIGVKKLYFSKK